MQQGLPESLAASLVRLRAVRQHRAVRPGPEFNSCVDAVESEVMQEVTRLQDKLRQQQEQGRTLAQLSFRPDVMLSLDEQAVPALRHVLTSNSRVLERMFAAHTAEAQSGTIKTEATLSVLEHVMKSLHCVCPAKQA